MTIKACLFDLDGTLLPMDQDEFLKTYFGLLAGKMAAHGYEPKRMIDVTWKGTAAMIGNDGSRPNSDAFWRVFAREYGEERLVDLPLFDAFYRDDFDAVKVVAHPDPRAAEAVHTAKAAGMRTVLATNPVFPAAATVHRMRWAGLGLDDFEMITTYENIGFCKPNPAYYTEIARRLSVDPAACVMVGNDTDDDLAAAKAGMQVFLLTDRLIDRHDTELSGIPHGGFDALISWIRSLN